MTYRDVGLGQAWMCNQCGSLVYDEAVHDRWHEKQAAVARDAWRGAGPHRRYA